MLLRFAKMHGLGNDFMVIDAVNQQVALSATQIQTLADRHRGVGFDQCLIIEPSTEQGIDFNYRIFNNNGKEVGQCGNGARCLAVFAKHYELSTKTSLSVATKTTCMALRINEDGRVSVNMGVPKLAPADIPFIAPKQAESYLLELDKGRTVPIHALGLGNPHAVLLVDNVDKAEVQSLGEQISRHARFPEQTNVGFMQILNPKEIKLRVYERGSAETQACGSGAVAAAAIGRLYHQLTNSITVHLPGGDLQIDWEDKQSPIFLTGSATFVYEGTVWIN